jgi:hypothetical protein
MKPSSIVVLATMAVTLFMVLPVGPACGEELLSPEQLMPVHEARDAYTPGAAFGKDTYLVAWQSGRLAPGDIRKGLVCIGDIVGCRVGKGGKPLDEKPLVISAAKDMQERPRIAFGQEDFLVVWQDLRNGKDWDVYAARVTPDGKVLDPDGVLVAGGAHNQAIPRVAWDGKTFYVVWQDFRSGNRYEVYGARVDVGGRVLDAGGVLLASGPGSFHRYTPDVAAAGDGRSYTVWVGNILSGGGQMFAGRFVAEGAAGNDLAYEEVVKSPVRGKEGGPGHAGNLVSLACGGGGFMVMWTTFAPAGRGNVRGSADAALLDVDGKRIKSVSVAGGESRVRDPDVCWDGSTFAAAWHYPQCQSADAVPKGARHDGVFFRRVLPGGETPHAPLAVAGTFASPAAQACVASDGSGTTLVAYERHPERADVPIAVGFRMLAK